MRIPERQAELDAFYRRYLDADDPHSESNGSKNGRGHDPKGDLRTADEVIEKLLSEGTDKGRRLFEGDISGYTSASEADLAFFSKVYFYTQDFDTVVEVYRRSGLYRKKGDRPDYLRRTFDQAAMRATEFYDWSNGEAYFRRGGGSKGAADAAAEDDTGSERRKRGRPRKGIPDLEIYESWREQIPPIAYSLQSFRRYRDGYWPKEEEEAIRQAIWRYIKATVKNPTAHVTDRITKMARDDSYMGPDVWDQNPDILVLRNGTLEIADEPVLREHRPEDYALSAMPINYNPSARCPRWTESVLGRLQWGEPEFLQEFVGYCLTSDTSYEIAVWLAGDPGSGRSTFVDTVAAMFGDRAGTLSLSALGERFGLSTIPGKMLLKATEQPHEYLRATHVLDALISGESVQIDVKNKQPFDYESKAKILWAMNDLPTVRNPNDGLFRRVKIVEWPRPVANPDRELKKYLRDHELPGILNWALEGLRRLRERGKIATPATIQAATDQFQADSDVIGQFIAEKCIVAAGREHESRAMFNAFREWAIDSGHGQWSKTRFTRDLKRRGHPLRESSSSRYYRGITLRK